MEAAFPLIFLFCFAFTRSSSDPGPVVPAVASGGVCWLRFLYLMRGFHTFPPSAVRVAKQQRGSVPGAVLGPQELPSVSFYCTAPAVVWLCQGSQRVLVPSPWGR